MIDNVQSLNKAIEEVREAQERFSHFSKEEVDRIFYESAMAAAKKRIDLAFMAVRETGMGVAEDKVIKNHYASEFVYNAYKDLPSCDIIEEDHDAGLIRRAEPVGVIAALIPVTNPTSTAIFKALITLKTRNGIVICPHPRAKECTREAVRIIHDAAVAAGAPRGIIACIDEPSHELTDIAMKECDIILATGGSAMVRAAYSSGRPALGVGSGNTPCIIDESADIRMAAASVIHSKTFDNGVICASEQAVIVDDGIYSEVKKEFSDSGCRFLRTDEAQRLRSKLFNEGKLNAELVGKSAYEVARSCGIEAEESVKLLICEVSRFDDSEVMAKEKLCPVIAMYRSKSFENSLLIARELIRSGGYGHTASIFCDNETGKAHIKEFTKEMKACRILINQPAAQGAIGDIYNFVLSPSLTLGCGSWGGNSVCENVGAKHLLNIKSASYRRENMLWFYTPEKIFIKNGCLLGALDEIEGKRVFIVTDEYLYKNGYLSSLTEELTKRGKSVDVYYDVKPDPTLSSAMEGAMAMRGFEPDTVIAYGGGSAMDAAKVMWVSYEYPDASFEDMSMRFADIRKRIYKFGKMGKKASFIAVPTTAGTGSEVTPFAVITDEKTGIKYPLADYELMPDMAIIDPLLTKNAPKALTAASGIDALTHAIEAYVSMVATDYTDALALHSVRLLFRYLPRAYERGGSDMEAREGVANAATMAGMAFANAFLGICHSMAHKLGAFFSLPHGISNALLIEEVIRFNASSVPVRMGTFSQYKSPDSKRRYGEIARALGLKGKNDNERTESLIKAVRELKRSIGIKDCIRDYGIKEEDYMKKVDEMSLLAFDDQCTGANPRYPLISEIKEIYLRAYKN